MNIYSHFNPVGLAVSGGVDSMALASLSAQLLQSPSSIEDERDLPKSKLSLTGFIVDHGLREESTREAQNVFI